MPGGIDACRLEFVGFVCEWDALPIDAKIPDDAVYFDGRAYKACGRSMTWQEAKAYCEILGGHLVTITSQGEQEFITELLSDYPLKNLYWIGLYRDSQWAWVTGEDFSYAHWAYREPTSGQNEVCGEIYGNPISGFRRGEWNDSFNQADTISGFWNLSNVGFICEWETIP